MPKKKAKTAPKRTYSRELSPGKTALLKGWVAQIRDLGGLKFFMLRDSQGQVQVTLKKGEAPPALLKTTDSLNKEDLVAVTGEVKKSQAGSRRA